MILLLQNCLICYDIIMILLQNCYNVFDSTEVEHRNVSSIFALQNSKLDNCKCKAFLLDTIKYTIILYYYSMFLYHKGAWFTFQSKQPEAREGISDVFTSKPPFSSSVMSSTKRPFYAIFTHSHHTKIIKITFQNPFKPLKNKAFIELNQKIPYLTTKNISQTIKTQSQNHFKHQ